MMNENTLISGLENGRSEFFELLWKRMSDKGDFPALSVAVQKIVEAMHDEDHNVSELTSAILSDFALTQKVIRLANSAMYSSIGGEITTVTKAALVLGVDAIGHLAMSVRFLDTLSSSIPDSAMARSEMAKSLLAGEMARRIAHKANLKDVEEAVVCALLHHLGRLLLVFYFPEEWKEITRITEGRFDEENSAAEKVIGLSLDEISEEAAKRWRIPSKIASSMLYPPQSVGTALPGSSEWLKLVAGFSGEAASLAMEGEPGLDALIEKYGEGLLVPLDAISESVDSAVMHAKETALLLDVDKTPSSGKPEDAKERLEIAIQDFMIASKSGLSFGNALNLALETLYSSMGFNRVAAILRDGGTLKGRVGFGEGMPEILSRLVVRDSDSSDLFHLALSKNADIFIENVDDSHISGKLPHWFGTSLSDVQSFVLLPMTFNNHPIGAFYGDWRRGTMHSIDKEELGLMSSLRNHLMNMLNPVKN